MTPVEERIDHEHGLKIAEEILRTPICRTSGEAILARAYLALLTEHSAREEAIKRAIQQLEKFGMKGPKQVGRALITLEAALPATEPAQPEEEPLDLGDGLGL